MRKQSILPLLGVFVAAAGLGCAGAKTGGNGISGGGARGGSNGNVVTFQPCVNGECEDFPAAPIVVNGVSGSAFGNPAAGGGPCLFEPEPGAIFPQNWLRPRFYWVAPEDQTKFELRLHHQNQVNDLVVYTDQHEWTMPKDMWNKLRIHIQDSPIQMTITGAGSGGAKTGASGTFTIASAVATGDMLYWATAGATYADPTKILDNETALVGLNIGTSESTQVVLTPAEVQFQSKNKTGPQVQCVGCHTSVPGGGYVVFTDTWQWPLATASVSKTATGLDNGSVPPFVSSPGAIANLNMQWLGISTTSTGHWQPGEYIVVTNKATGSSDPQAQLIWINLAKDSTAQGEGWGVIARTGDTAGAASPAFYHDGSAIVYASTLAAKDGRLGSGTADLYTVPYGDTAGGTATPLGGASSPDMAEYYPALSIDDKLVAFTALDNATAALTCGNGELCGMYAAARGEIFVVPSDGSATAPTRLMANDPPECSSGKSPGVSNSWPKWSPDAVRARNGVKYYWLVFSSKRAGYLDTAGRVAAQLYLTAVAITEDEFGSAIATFPAIRLWNQPDNISNHTPAWDIFNLAAIP